MVYCFHRSVNKRADNGTTPVYFAAQEGRLECLKFLIAQASGHIIHVSTTTVGSNVERQGKATDRISHNFNYSMNVIAN